MGQFTSRARTGSSVYIHSECSYHCCAGSAQTRVRILRKIADDLQSNEQLIIERNMRDVAAAERKKVDATLLQRLRLKPAKIRTLVQGIRAIADQDEPLRKASPLPTLSAYLSLLVNCAVHLDGVVGLRASQSCRHVCQDGVFPVQCDRYCMMCRHCNIHPEPTWPLLACSTC